MIFASQGLEEFAAALVVADRDLRVRLDRALGEIAADVATKARGLASQRTTRHTGDLVAGIEPYRTRGGFGVRSAAMHGGYAYPRRLEFEGGFAGGTGPRASLLPAVEEDRELIEARLAAALGATLNDLGGHP